jgi:hypothetical protein
LEEVSMPARSRAMFLFAAERKVVARPWLGIGVRVRNRVVARPWLGIGVRVRNRVVARPWLGVGVR